MHAVVHALRPPFLLLAGVCVLLGVALAGPGSDWAVVAWVAIGALAAHAAVNLLNEWHDFRSGLDAMTERTPFSGGSGALPARPDAAPRVLAAGMATLALTGGIGLWLLQRSPALLWPGLAGLVLVLAYTPWITRHPWACLLAPGLGFGPLVTGGTVIALTGGWTPGAVVMSLLPLAMVSGLLLLNQFPDVDADRRVGRRHLPMLRGRRWAAGLLAVLLAVAYAAPLLGVLAGAVPRGALLAGLTAPLAVSVARGARRHADDVPALTPVMGRNVALVLSTPLLAAVGLWTIPA